MRMELMRMIYKKCCLIWVLIVVKNGYCQSVNNCGVGGSGSGLVVGGNAIDRGQWPWLGAIYSTAVIDKGFICGSTLISGNLIVTAAHCIQNKLQKVPRAPNEIVIYLGKYNLDDSVERGSIPVYPSDIRIHPDWNYLTDRYDADIAVIVIENPVQLSQFIFPACLWYENEEPTVKEGTIVGWGKTDLGLNIYESIPRQVKLKLVINNDCILGDPKFATISSNRTFCAGGDGGGPCTGDSGGGLFVKVERKWYLRGIVSASFIENNLCDVNSYAIFTNAVLFKEWIIEVAGSLSALPQPQIPLYSMVRKPKLKKSVVCYISSWAVYRPRRGSFSINNFNPDLCTHVVYCFAGLDGDLDTIKANDPWQDLEDKGGKGGYKKLVSYKISHPHLKVLLAIGGWDEGSVKFSNLAADPVKRARFVTNSVEFLKKFNFDGLDFVWEYPAHRGGSIHDKDNFAQLIEQLSLEYKKHSLFLSAVLRAPQYIVDSAYDVRRLGKDLDAMHLFTFDYAGSWDKKIGFQAPLRSESVLNVQSTIDYYLKLGAPAEKLIISMPFFGRTFITNEVGKIGDESLATGFDGPFVKENGKIGYNEICSLMLNQFYDWYKQWDGPSSEVLARYHFENVTYAVTYDSSRSIANKVRYAMRKNLGGISGWDISMDDFQGDCTIDNDTFIDFKTISGVELKFPTRKEKDFPLLRTINE
ncbi:unnamed protein product, partial [Diamesa serratosioi]